MIKSMTGYGRGNAQQGNLQIEVEAKSVNHRYCNINLKIPRQLAALENQGRSYVSQRFARGRLDVFISLQQSEGGKTLQLNLPLAKQYYQALQQLKQELALTDEVSLSLLAQNNDLFEFQETREDESQIWPLLEQALKECLDNLDTMRIKEGILLEQDILNRCRCLEEGILQLEPKLTQLPATIKERLSERIEQNFPQLQVDDNRLLQELAFYVDRSDTTEEVVRFKSHLQQFQEWLKGEETPIGKKLDFIIQEMNRELTTLGAKVNDSQVSQAVVELKSELEKIREQVQNIE